MVKWYPLRHPMVGNSPNVYIAVVEPAATIRFALGGTRGMRGSPVVGVAVVAGGGCPMNHGNGVHRHAVIWVGLSLQHPPSRLFVALLALLHPSSASCHAAEHTQPPEVAQPPVATAPFQPTHTVGDPLSMDYARLPSTHILVGQRR